jgi:hypothetical protein
MQSPVAEQGRPAAGDDRTPACEWLWWGFDSPLFTWRGRLGWRRLRSWPAERRAASATLGAMMASCRLGRPRRIVGMFTRRPWRCASTGSTWREGGGQVRRRGGNDGEQSWARRFGLLGETRMRERRGSVAHVGSWGALLGPAGRPAAEHAARQGRPRCVACQRGAAAVAWPPGPCWGAGPLGRGWENASMRD